jgi:indole-3-glycerol phosphate synthase
MKYVSSHHFGNGIFFMILDDIVAYKKDFVAAVKRRISLGEIQVEALNAHAPKSFYDALCSPDGSIRVIAEVKKASPSKGVIREDFDPVWIARRYEDCGAAAISVLTDEKFFQGSLEYLKQVRGAIFLPILRKEFIIDEYQISEARAAGADAILLIAAILDDAEMKDFYDLARSLGMSVLLEVHSEDEAERALRIGPRFIGVNNRNLKDFTVDIRRTELIRRMIPEDICLVSESGIRSAVDIAYLKNIGAKAILVGETLMRSADPGLALRELIGGRG